MTAVTRKDQARDLEADLAICEAAMPGPYEITHFISATNSDGRLDPRDAKFYSEAITGWPYAIRRALEAEAEIDKLRDEISQLYEALNQRGCGL